MKSVLVVILNYKGWRDTLKCLESLRAQTFRDFEILLIDNGSGDESVAELSKAKMPKLHFRKEPKNTGFTGGVNIGIRWAIENSFENVALLNNDAWAEPEWLENLVKGFENSPEIGAVTSLMLNKTGEKIDDAGDIYSTWGVPSLRGEGEPRESAPESGLVFGATGGATIYKTEVFEKIGLFDEDFFAYNEDVDIDWRMQLAGFKIWYEKSAVVWHKHSATSSKIPGFTINQVFKNLPQVFWKNVPMPMIFWMWPKFALVYTAFIFYQIPKGGVKFALKGFWQSLKLTPAAFRKRRKIQREKVVSNAYISSILYHGLPLRQVNRIKEFFRISK